MEVSMSAQLNNRYEKKSR